MTVAEVVADSFVENFKMPEQRGTGGSVMSLHASFRSLWRTIRLCCSQVFLDWAWHAAPADSQERIDLSWFVIRAMSARRAASSRRSSPVK